MSIEKLWMVGRDTISFGKILDVDRGLQNGEYRPGLVISEIGNSRGPTLCRMRPNWAIFDRQVHPCIRIVLVMTIVARVGRYTFVVKVTGYLVPGGAILLGHFEWLLVEKVRGHNEGGC